MKIKITTNEMKLIQKAIKSFNTTMQNTSKYKGIGDSSQGVLDTLIGFNHMTSKGYAKYSKKFLSSMTRSELMRYTADIMEAKKMLENMKELDELVELGAEIALKGDRADLWRVYNELANRGYKLDSEQMHDLITNEETGSITDIVNSIIRVADSSDYGMADLDQWFNNLKGI